MCLYPRLMINRKYRPTKKNNYNPPVCTDDRVKFVAVGCGNCIECREQKAKAWRVRLMEELKAYPEAYFVTLSFSPQALQELTERYNIKNVNEVATKSMRLYLERWRKKYKKSLKHWLVTELGQTNTERLHFHGIVWCKQKQVKDLTEKWQYGNTWIGNYCSEKTVNYIVKYTLKIDPTHPTYKSIVLASPAIGKSFVENNKRDYIYKPHKTTEFYKLPNGTKISLPIYYRNKLFTEEERERLWLDRLETETIYVRGTKFDISSVKGMVNYEKFLRMQQKKNETLGYGNDTWKSNDYIVTLSMLNSNHAQT